MRKAYCSIMLAASALMSLEPARAEGARELRVHLAQANNQSPYTFVRARFKPGEVVDPWTVRFINDQGEEIPYFVWDSITWRVAREGRADWGKSYALLNHGPGAAPEVLKARPRKLQVLSKHFLPIRKTTSTSLSRVSRNYSKRFRQS